MQGSPCCAAEAFAAGFAFVSLIAVFYAIFYMFSAFTLRTEGAIEFGC